MTVRSTFNLEGYYLSTEEYFLRERWGQFEAGQPVRLVVDPDSFEPGINDGHGNYLVVPFDVRVFTGEESITPVPTHLIQSLGQRLNYEPKPGDWYESTSGYTVLIRRVAGSYDSWDTLWFNTFCGDVNDQKGSPGVTREISWVQDWTNQKHLLSKGHAENLPNHLKSSLISVDSTFQDICQPPK